MYRFAVQFYHFSIDIECSGVLAQAALEVFLCFICSFYNAASCCFNCFCFVSQVDCTSIFLLFVYVHFPHVYRLQSPVWNTSIQFLKMKKIKLSYRLKPFFLSISSLKKIKTKLERQAEYNLNFKYIYADVQTAK